MVYTNPKQDNIYVTNIYVSLCSVHVTKRPLGRPRRRWGDNIKKQILGKYGGKVWTGCMWLRRGSSGGLFWTRKWTFGFPKRRWIYWV